MSAHDGEAPDVDPVTGYETTGHDWNGIKELNTPFPIFVITSLGLTVVYSIIAWLLLEGDGWAVFAGAVVAAVSVLGLFLTLRPSTGADLED